MKIKTQDLIGPGSALPIARVRMPYIAGQFDE